MRRLNLNTKNQTSDLINILSSDLNSEDIFSFYVMGLFHLFKDLRVIRTLISKYKKNQLIGKSFSHNLNIIFLQNNVNIFRDFLSIALPFTFYSKANKDFSNSSFHSSEAKLLSIPLSMKLVLSQSCIDDRCCVDFV